MGIYSTRGRGFNTEDTESAEKKAKKKEFRMRHKKKKWGRHDCLSHDARVVLLFGGRGFGSGVGVLLGEAFDAASGVNEFLFACEEWVAIRADLHAQHVALDGGARLERMAAGAVHGHGMIIGMNTGFHGATFRRVRSARQTRQSQVNSKL